MKKLVVAVFAILLLGNIYPAFATDCHITDKIRCDFDDTTFVLVEKGDIVVYHHNAGSGTDEVLASTSFNEIFDVVNQIGTIGDAMVRRGQLDANANTIDLRETAIELGIYPQLRERILPNGHMYLASSIDEKVHIYLLTNTPEVQINIGPDVNGDVQVLVLALFQIPVFYAADSFNIYDINFKALAEQDQ